MPARRRRSYRRRSRMNPRRRVYRRRRHNAYFPNPHRRRRYTAKTRHVRRRHYRRNPINVLGFDLKSLAIAGGAVLLDPILESKLLQALPASISGGKLGRWAVKVGTAAGISFIAKRTIGGNAGNLAMIALGANLIADFVSEFVMPAALPAASTGYYQMRRYVPALGMGANPRYALPFAGVNARSPVPMTKDDDPFQPSWYSN